jgi:hypothetical protein
MLPPSPQRSPDVPYRARAVIWLALVVATGLYFVVTKLAAPSGAQANPTLVTILFVFSAGLVAGSFGMKARLLSRASRPSSRMRQQAELIALILCEAAAVLGVVVWFVTAWPHYYIFLLLGLVGMLLHFPTREG